MSDWKEAIARRLRTFHLDSIRSQILVFAVVATLVPTAALTIVASRQTSRAAEDCDFFPANGEKFRGASRARGR